MDTPKHIVICITVLICVLLLRECELKQTEMKLKHELMKIKLKQSSNPVDTKEVEYVK